MHYMPDLVLRNLYGINPYNFHKKQAVNLFSCGETKPNLRQVIFPNSGTSKAAMPGFEFTWSDLIFKTIKI